jgi:flagellar protein FlbD
MIHVTRLNHTPVVINSDLIEHIESTPDTVISLTTGQKIMVLESTEEVIERIRQFRQSLMPQFQLDTLTRPDHCHGRPENREEKR